MYNVCRLSTRRAHPQPVSIRNNLDETAFSLSISWAQALTPAPRDAMGLFIKSVWDMFKEEGHVAGARALRMLDQLYKLEGAGQPASDEHHEAKKMVAKYSGAAILADLLVGDDLNPGEVTSPRTRPAHTPPAPRSQTHTRVQPAVIEVFAQLLYLLSEAQP